MKWLFLLVVALNPLVVECALNSPRGVKLLSVTVVDYKEQGELPFKGSGPVYDPYRDYLMVLSEKEYNAIHVDDIEPYFTSPEAKVLRRKKSSRPLLKVKFQSDMFLLDFAYKKHYSVSIAPYFCSNKDAHIFWGLPSVYWRGLDMGAPFKYAIDERTNALLTYYAFINIAFDPTGPSSYEHFDLRDEPADICFQLKGGAVGRGFESNIVTIPKAKIIKALESLPSILEQE